MSWPALDAKLLADAAATFNFRLGQPSALAVTPDGAVLFRRTPPREFAADLYELDTKTGKIRTLVSVAEVLGTGAENLSDAEKARRERSRTATRGVVDIDVSADGRLVMVPLAGAFYVIDRASGARRSIDPGGEAYDPHLSPDGSRIAFGLQGDLYVQAAGSSRPEALVRSGNPKTPTDWSRDSRTLVYTEVDSKTQGDVWVISDPGSSPARKPMPFLTTESSESQGRLSPDGRWMAYTSDESGHVLSQFSAEAMDHAARS